MNTHFKRGLLSPLLVLDSQTIKRIRLEQEEHLSDTQVLHSDWQKVGDSLCNAMNRANTECDTSGK